MPSNSTSKAFASRESRSLNLAPRRPTAKPQPDNPSSMRPSCRGIIASALPGFIMLGLFYSLALHMYWSLGGWPTSMGERGFPAPLLVHVNVTVYFFIALILFGTFVLPVAILVCLLRGTWRRFIPYFALYALLFGICWAVMQLAPEPFLYWWRD